jgi:hypothetical protein
VDEGDVGANDDREHPTARDAARMKATNTREVFMVTLMSVMTRVHSTTESTDDA